MNARIGLNFEMRTEINMAYAKGGDCGYCSAWSLPEERGGGLADAQYGNFVQHVRPLVKERV